EFYSTAGSRPLSVGDVAPVFHGGRALGVPTGGARRSWRVDGSRVLGAATTATGATLDPIRGRHLNRSVAARHEAKLTEGVQDGIAHSDFRPAHRVPLAFERTEGRMLTEHIEPPVARAENEAQRAIEQLQVATRLSGVNVWSWELASSDVATAMQTD